MSSGIEQLLEVQALDTERDQLEHRRATLPERGAVAEAERTIAAIDAEIEDRRAPRHDLERQQKRIEDELATIEERIAREDARLYDGTVTAIKELQALQEEIASLRRRQDDLETQVLELLDAAEPIDAELERLFEQRSQQAQHLEEHRGALAAEETAIEDELARVERERSERVEGIAGDLLAEYERIRAGRGGVGVARLVGSSCGGCHLGLSAVELDRIRREPPDALVHCEECGRILVR